MRKPADLQGLIPDAVGDVLAELAAAVPAGQAIVEIGSFKGKSTCFLASGAAEDVHVWAVDPWDLTGNPTGRFGFADPSTREQFDRQVEEAGYADKITAIRGFSVDVAATWDGPPIGLLYIDGDHSEGAVYDDYRAWSRWLDIDHVVVFDDLDTPRNPGVRRALEKLCLRFEVRAERLAVCSV